MRHLFNYAITGIWLITTALAVAQSPQRTPHIGYAYPAGGQQGTSFTVMVGGQYLGAVDSVHISGDDVTATVVKHYRIGRNINGDQRKLLTKQFDELTRRRWTELYKAGWVKLPDPPGLKKRPKKTTKTKPSAKTGAPKAKNKTTKDKPVPKIKPYQHPLLENMDKKNLWQLAHARNQLFADRKKRQPNAQIGEIVLINVTLAPQAKPGTRELRLGARNGLTNPVFFQVGTLMETRETEPNDPNLKKRLPLPPPLKIPLTINGQLNPGDVDRFRFLAKQGQQLVVETHARSLVPFLADAVPGWLQATLTLYDDKGSEIAFADDFRFHPDPVLMVTIPRNGTYKLEIHDSIFRGREDFVYRISVSEKPFITRIFPLGAQEKSKTTATIAGWNLPFNQLQLDTNPNGSHTRQTTITHNNLPSNSVLYAIDTLPETLEAENNNTITDSQFVALPTIINGHITTAGDIDTFRFLGQKNSEIVADITARRLHSPLDSLIRLTDAKGNILAWNDDNIDKKGHLHRDMGYLTHHADSYLRAKLPETGFYYIHLADAQNRGGDAFAYRLRISQPRPDYAVHLTPSSLFMRAGIASAIDAYILRKDGFNNPIQLKIVSPHDGFNLHGATIPPGCNHARLTLTPSGAPEGSTPLQIVATSTLNGQPITRDIIPSDNVMQAFLWRHLAPAKQLLTSIKGRGKARYSIESHLPVYIQPGGTATVNIKTPKGPWFRSIDLKLNNPPTGITLANLTQTPQGLSFQLQADSTASEQLNDNLIIEIFREVNWGKKDSKGKQKKRLTSQGFLPAIPIQIKQNTPTRP